MKKFSHGRAKSRERASLLQMEESPERIMASHHPVERKEGMPPSIIPCGGYFLRYDAYFYRFYVLYAMYHPLLCLAEAFRLGHPFGKQAY